MTVAIVGGGVVGLTGAIALREAGLEATVYDRVEDVAAAQIGARASDSPSTRRACCADSVCSTA